MKVTVTRSGGIAGVTTTAAVDTGSLDAYRAHAIEAIVAQATAATDRGAMTPDAFQYDVTIVDETGSKQMCFHGDPCPAADLFRAIRSASKR